MGAFLVHHHRRHILVALITVPTLIIVDPIIMDLIMVHLHSKGFSDEHTVIAEEVVLVVMMILIDLQLLLVGFLQCFYLWFCMCMESVGN